MPSDPSNEDVTARMFFCGVMLMCINKSGECEVGLIQDNPLHLPTLRIETHVSGVKTLEVRLPLTRDIRVTVVNPLTHGVTKFDHPGNPHDFGLVPDFEGSRMHGIPANVNTSLLTSRLCISDGLLYTVEPSPSDHDLIEWSAWDPVGVPVPPIPYGRVSQKAALNIICEDVGDSGVELTDKVTSTPVAILRRLPNTRYEIHVENDCNGTTSVPVGTDFRLYYTVISPSDGRKFDFRKHNGPFPEVCEEAFLSRTNSLGF